jgi:hypothetical protein
MKRIATTSILIAAGLAFAEGVPAQSADSSAALVEAHAGFVKRTESRFGQFAGSETNADRLANGLRNGTPVTLTGSGERATFTPPTKPMGYGNVTRALDLAQRQLAADGITRPTPTELRTALMGGTLNTPDGPVQYAGVLQLRSEGMGWGQVAHTIGVHPGMGKSAAAPAPVRVTPTPVSHSVAGSKSGIVTAAGTRPAGVYGNSYARGNSGNVKVASSAPGGAAGSSGAAAGVTTAAAGNAAGGNAFGKGNGNAFGHAK